MASTAERKNGKSIRTSGGEQGYHEETLEQKGNGKTGDNVNLGNSNEQQPAWKNGRTSKELCREKKTTINNIVLTQKVLRSAIARSKPSKPDEGIEEPKMSSGKPKNAAKRKAKGTAEMAPNKADTEKVKEVTAEAVYELIVKKNPFFVDRRNEETNKTEKVWEAKMCGEVTSANGGKCQCIAFIFLQPEDTKAAEETGSGTKTRETQIIEFKGTPSKMKDRDANLDRVLGKIIELWKDARKQYEYEDGGNGVSQTKTLTVNEEILPCQAYQDLIPLKYGSNGCLAIRGVPSRDFRFCKLFMQFVFTMADELAVQARGKEKTWDFYDRRYLTNLKGDEFRVDATGVDTVLYPDRVEFMNAKANSLEAREAAKAASAARNEDKRNNKGKKGPRAPELYKCCLNLYSRFMRTFYNGTQVLGFVAQLHREPTGDSYSTYKEENNPLLPPPATDPKDSLMAIKAVPQKRFIFESMMEELKKVEPVIREQAYGRTNQPGLTDEEVSKIVSNQNDVYSSSFVKFLKNKVPNVMVAHAKLFNGVIDLKKTAEDNVAFVANDGKTHNHAFNGKAFQIEEKLMKAVDKLSRVLPDNFTLGGMPKAESEVPSEALRVGPTKIPPSPKKRTRQSSIKPVKPEKGLTQEGTASWLHYVKAPNGEDGLASLFENSEKKIKDDHEYLTEFEKFLEECVWKYLAEESGGDMDDLKAERDLTLIPSLKISLLQRKLSRRTQMFHLDFPRKVVATSHTPTSFLGVMFCPLDAMGMWIRILPSLPVKPVDATLPTTKLEVDTEAEKELDTDSKWKDEGEYMKLIKKKKGTPKIPNPPPPKKCDGEFLFIPKGQICILPSSLYHSEGHRTSPSGAAYLLCHVVVQNKDESKFNLVEEIKSEDGYHDNSYIEKYCPNNDDVQVTHIELRKPGEQRMRYDTENIRAFNEFFVM